MQDVVVTRRRQQGQVKRQNPDERPYVVPHLVAIGEEIVKTQRLRDAVGFRDDELRHRRQNLRLLNAKLDRIRQLVESSDPNEAKETLRTISIVLSCEQ